MARRFYIKDLPNRKRLDDIFSINRGPWMQREVSDNGNRRFAFYYGKLLCEAHWLPNLNEITVTIYGKDRTEGDAYILYGTILGEMANSLGLEEHGIKVRHELDVFADRYELSIIFYTED